MLSLLAGSTGLYSTEDRVKLTLGISSPSLQDAGCALEPLLSSCLDLPISGVMHWTKRASRSLTFRCVPHCQAQGKAGREKKPWLGTQGLTVYTALAQDIRRQVETKAKVPPNQKDFLPLSCRLLSSSEDGQGTVQGLKAQMDRHICSSGPTRC